MPINDLVKIERAVISVSNKTGLEQLGADLEEFGIEILSTGGTHERLKTAGVGAVEISVFTGSPEVMDGRVKTLHPKVAGGILFRRDNEDDINDLKTIGGQPIDLVVVNLYPFQKTVADPKATDQEKIDDIDIGGPTMVRAAAKNFDSVCVIVDPTDYPLLIAELRKNDGQTTRAFRKRMAAKAFAHTCNYELAIGQYLSDGEFDGFTGHKVAN